MALGGCYACIKYLMFAFNFIYWLSGCAILGVGIWLRVDPNATDIFNKSPKVEIFYIVAYVLIAIGFLIMVIGFLGCCGAVRESQVMLATFFVLLFLIFAALLGFGIWAAVAKETVKNFTDEFLIEEVKKYPDNPEIMDSIQRSLECCGATKGAVDYITSGNILATNQHTCHPENILKPCSDAAFKLMENKLIIIAGVAIGFAVQMILGMIFSMLLCCAIRDQVA